MNSLLSWKKAIPITIEHPRSPFQSLQQEVDKAFRDFYDVLAPRKWEQFDSLDLMPSMDVVEDKDSYTVQVEMPGMDEKDIKVSFSENTLTITGEKSSSKKNKDKKFVSREISYGKVERSISLPATVDVGKAKASFKKGMLWVVLPKKSESKQSARDIKIEKAQ